MLTPIQPRTTFPFSRSWGRISFATLMGTEKPTPAFACAPPVTIRVLMPTTSPRVLMSGPPELPGLMAASVWIIPTEVPRTDPSGRSRPTNDTTPTVTLLPPPGRSNGLPTAMTHSPTSVLSESPRGRAVRGPSASILRRPTSVRASRPTIFAS